MVAVETLKAYKSFNLPADIPVAHSQREQADDLTLYLVGQRGLDVLSSPVIEVRALT